MGTYSKLLQTTPNPVEKAEQASVSVPEEASEPAIQSAEEQERKHASMQANKLASKQESKLTRPHVNLHDHMLALLEVKATYGFTFRYPPELLDLLEDMLHDIKKRHKVKLTKNAVAVAAIVFFLSDYETFGEESVLFQMLIEQPAE